MIKPKFLFSKIFSSETLAWAFNFSANLVGSLLVVQNQFFRAAIQKDDIKISFWYFTVTYRKQRFYLKLPFCILHMYLLAVTIRKNMFEADNKTKVIISFSASKESNIKDENMR